ncbi:MAG: class I SAM-dependent DNA methyltransferase [Synergistaceae bacterium]|nr:class I SAM-dependent DNA methyltransferase [Synergistaceae bacterium]
MAMTNEILGFVTFWENHGDEKSDTQKFWIDLLRNVLSLEYPERFIKFEKRVALEHMSYIDAYIPSTRTIIEQKSFDVNLDKSIMQSDGTSITPFQQAKRYSDWLPDSQRARWIVICNFQEFRIYDMEKPKSKPEIISLQSLKTQWHKLSFLVDVNTTNIREVELSVKAGKLVGKLYDSLLKRYINPDDKESQRSLNVFCVRVVFLLYAEDAGLFKKNQFHNYLKARELVARNALRDLFIVLNQRPEERDPYLEADLKEFPYVNGGLFSGNDIELPQLDGEPLRIILEEMSESFDWSGISPTIFGAVFESTLNPKTRHSGGMHYTSVENIHKVINPLFLDELNKEFDAIIKIPVSRSRTQKLRAFQKKLGTLKFFDPACGSGNFLTESYLSLRRLENKILSLISKQISFADSQDETAIQVSISQFYGIEINDFAVSVARTALWIAEAQMWNETKNIILFYGDLLPLKSYNNIIEGNALHIDWNEVVKSSEVNFIIGNPPFIGQSVRTKEQSDDMAFIWGKGEIETKLDYVICWYKKAIDYIKGTTVKVAFVSTNSICQGESVPTFWKKMIDDGAVINFAYKPFVWSSEAIEKAAVHCVIIGFSNFESNETKFIFDGGNKTEASHINPYLYDAPDIWITNRINKPQNGLPKMTTGSPPTDDGGLLMTTDEKLQLEAKYPILTKYIKPFIGAREFLHDKIGAFSRYCFWFKDGNPSDYTNIPEIKARLQKVRTIRGRSNANRIQKMVDYPYLFCQIRQPESTYLVIPRVSSETRKYIPLGFISPDVIASDACIIIPNVSIYEFAILSSRIHMAWVNIVAGRLKSDIRYSPSVYNNFIWPSPNEKQKSKIESTAKKILDIRAQFPDSSLADLYDPLTMPEELLKAHRSNDAAVCEAYGFDKEISDEKIVAELINMYNNIINIH